jgi:hypothetical protein
MISPVAETREGNIMTLYTITNPHGTTINIHHTEIRPGSEATIELDENEFNGLHSSGFRPKLVGAVEDTLEPAADDFIEPVEAFVEPEQEPEAVEPTQEPVAPPPVEELPVVEQNQEGVIAVVPPVEPVVDQETQTVTLRGGSISE